MRFLVSDLLLFSCLAVLITGMVIVVASLLIKLTVVARMGELGRDSSACRAPKPRHGRSMAGFCC
jgi:Na+-transporting methylmalonyl-CoA/oxaloacetate decarboxylase gamma subunit